MKAVSQQYIDTLRQNVDVWSKVRLTCEWNQNRHADIELVTNWGTPEGYLEEFFPIDSIVSAHRPKRGILFGWAPPAGSTPESFTSDGYEDTRGDSRFYTASKDFKYKYWTSETQSNTSSPHIIANVNPAVIYSKTVYTNKIRIGFETSVAYPTQYLVEVTSDGTTWTNIGGNFAIDSDGIVDIYLQDNSSWGTEENMDIVTQLKGVRVIVNQMSAGNVRFSLIELGLRLQLDMSDRVISYRLNEQLSDTSFFAPLGKASTNEASVVLDNTDGGITNDNETSMLYGLIDKGVEFRLDLGINTATLEQPSFEWTRQFTMISKEWSGQDRDGTTAMLTDSSDILKSINPNPAFYTKKTMGEVIWSILDSVGFSSWEYLPDSDLPSTIMPTWWTSGEESVWESITDIAEVMQAAVFFDEYDILQIRPRDSVYNPSDTPVWNMFAQDFGSIRPDIEKLTKEYEFEANTVKITYSPTSISEETQAGVIPMEIVWEPEDTVSLRSTDLYTDITGTSTFISISPNDAEYWPYEGVIQVEGEFIKYRGKQYFYNTVNSHFERKTIYSEEERIALDRRPNTNLAVNNKFTGALLIAERGYWDSEIRNHLTTPPTWFSRISSNVRTTEWNSGVVLDKNAGGVRLRTNSTFGSGTRYVCTRGSSAQSPYRWYGTRVKFDGTQGNGHAGIAWSVGANDNGYYMELTLTEMMTSSVRAIHDEVTFSIIPTMGTVKRYGSGGRGATANIAKGVWYDLDVEHFISGSNEYVRGYVNGILKINVAFPISHGPPEALGRRHGLFTRGNTSAVFEYLYGANPKEELLEDAPMRWNRIYGGYQSAIPRSIMPYELYDDDIGMTQTTAANNINNFWMQDFLPVVHEVRDFEVKFDPSPVLHSQLYFSNESQVAAPRYSADSFGAKFTLANVSRNSAVLNGEDTLTFGPDNPAEQKLFIFGRSFIRKDDVEKTVKNEESVRKRGEVLTEISSEWIQTETEADSLGKWIVDNWSNGNDQIVVESFGNPILQIGDLVSINYDEINMAGTEYYVVGKEESYEQGLTTRFEMRRKIT